MELAGKRILITGGAGLIGSWTAELLMADKPAKVTVVDNMVRGRMENLKAAKAAGPLEFVEGDICDRALMDRLVKQSDVVFHMAALRITHCVAEPDLAFEVMARATFDLLQLCVEHKVGKIVAASSASIYGLADKFPTPETSNPYDNRTLYGAFKMLSEGMLRSFNDMYKLPYCAMRYFNVYGPRMDIHGKYTEVLIRWMECIKAGQAPVIFGDGSQTMDFVHVRDIARANILAAKTDVSDEVFNIAAGKEVSLRQLLDVLLKVMGRTDLKVEHQPERSVNPVPRRLADTSKAARLLGFRTEIGLEDGMRGLVDWWQETQPVLSAKAS